MAATAPGARVAQRSTLVAVLLALAAAAATALDRSRGHRLGPDLRSSSSGRCSSRRSVRRDGALAAALVEVFVPVSALERLGELPRPLRLPAAALAGVLFPTASAVRFRSRVD